MRVGHATDIHWMVPPSLASLPWKRILGTANLYLRGRKDHFSTDVQDALMQHLLDADLDLLIITGDLTAQALPAEFLLARESLTPVFEAIPSFVIPGNHDAYTAGAARAERIVDYFGPWMGREASGLGRLDLGNLTVLGLDPNRPTTINAAGEVPEVQLEALRATLADPALSGRDVLIAIHYPLLDRSGEVYDGWSHGLLNAAAVIDILREAPKTPLAVLCGHVHHGYRVEIPLGTGRSVPLFDSGSSGYAYMPEKRRAAASNVYTVSDGRLVDIERYLYDGEAFQPEPGGPYATGR